MKNHSRTGKSDGHHLRLARLRRGNVEVSFPVGGAAVSIGRDPQNTVFISDDRASKHHLSVAVRKGRVVAEDQTSLNGSWLNERRIYTHVVNPGDVLRVGWTLFVLLSDAMPVHRRALRSRRWIVAEWPGAVTKRCLPAACTMLIGRAPEADIRMAERGMADFQALVVATPDGAQVIELVTEPPRVVTLRDGAEMRMGGLVLRYRVEAESASDIHKRAQQRARAHDVHAAPVATAPPAQKRRKSSDASFLRILTHEAQRVDAQSNGAHGPGGGSRNPRRSNACKVTITHGPQAGQTFRMDGPPLTIGRDEKCAIQLTDPKASRRHAVIRLLEGDVIIEDQNSNNGVFLNGERIHRRLLKAGDVVRIGGTEFLVHL